MQRPFQGAKWDKSKGEPIVIAKGVNASILAVIFLFLVSFEDDMTYKRKFTGHVLSLKRFLFQPAMTLFVV